VRSKFVLRISFGLALAVLLAACSSGGSASPTANTQTVNLNALDTFKYDPNSITGKVGQPIHVVMANKGVLVHTFVIDALSVKQQNVQGGATADFTFTPTAAGTYQFYCDTPAHQAAGMVGTLTVTQ
jgi:uncharacterized cupredoxin-like copper-binding protein